MFEIVSSLNFVDPVELRESVPQITLRGHNRGMFLTGQFALKLAEREIRPLSVSDISDYLCPTRRDLYFKKGKNRPSGIRRTRTWGGIAGHLVEDYFVNLLSSETGRNSRLSYKTIKKAAKKRINSFKNRKQNKLAELGSLRGSPSENPEWLTNLLYHAGKVSLGFRSLDRILTKNHLTNSIKETDIVRQDIDSNAHQIGISRNVRPDFLLPSQKIVGDIKSGVIGFKDYFLNTCTGYALAYENANGEGNDIDIGVIFFFPTRCSAYAKPISFSQIYIFMIDDELRDQFKRRRNEAYNIISRETPPRMPDTEDRWSCTKCQFREVCEDGD